MVVCRVLYSDVGHSFGNTFAEPYLKLSGGSVHAPYREVHRTVQLASEVYYNGGVRIASTVVEHTLVMIVINGDLSRLVFVVLVLSAHVSLGQDNSCGEQRFSRAFIVNSVNAEFFLKFHN